MREGGRDYRRERKPDDEKLLRLPPPGKRSLVEKIYGSAGAQPAGALDPEAMAAVEAVLTSSDHPGAPQARAHLERALGMAFAEGPAAAEPGQRPLARGTTPPPAAMAEQPFLPAEVSHHVQAAPAARAGSQWGQAAPAASAGAQWGQAKQTAPAAEPEDGEVALHRSSRGRPDAPPASAAAAAQPQAPAAPPAAEVPGSEWAQARPKVQYVEARQAPEGEVALTRAERKRPAEKEASQKSKPAAAGHSSAAGPRATLQVLEDFDAGHEQSDESDQDESEIPENLEELDEERLDELASDLDLELPEGTTVEQKRKAIEAARAARLGKAQKGLARRAKEVAADAAADQAGIGKKGKAQAAGRAAQGKAAAGAAKAVAAKRSFAKAKNFDELKARLRKVMEEDKAKFDELFKKDSDELTKQIQKERDKASEELKTLDQKMAAEIAAKEKEITGHIEKKRAEAKARAETDRKNAQTTTEAEKKRRRDEANAEATRIEGEAAGRAAKARADGPDGQAEAQRITAEAHQAAAAARGKGDAAAQELDGKLAATLDKIARAEVEGAAELEIEKSKLIADSQARAKTAHDEGKARVDAAIVKINEQEKTGLERIKSANEGLRKQAQEKFDTQMKKLESGSVEQLAELEAETNKIIGEIDQEVVKFQAVAQQQTQAALEASKKAAQAAVMAIQAEGKKAIEQIDGLAKEAMERVDRKAAEMAARQAAVASEGQRRLTAATPEEAAAVEREAEAREKAEQDKVAAEKAAKAAEEKKIDDAAAEIADELDDTFVDEEAILNHLRGKSPEEIARIKEAYFIKTGRGKNLDKEVAGNSALDEKEMKEAKAHLSGDPVERAVATLENAEDGWTGEEDEQRIKETLAKLDPETRKKVAAEYEKQTGRRLNAMLADELDDEDRKGTYIEEDPKKKVAVSKETLESPAVNQAVIKLRGATDRWDTDEKAIYDALKGKTPEEIEAIRQVWDSKHAPPSLDAVLENEMSGTELKEAKAMMSSDPVQQAVASLENASDGIGTDVEKVQKTLESIKDPVLRAQVAAEYEKQTGQKLDAMLTDELSGRDLDKAQAAAAGDFAALRAIKFDEAKNGNFLADFSDKMADTLNIDRESMRILTDVAVFAAMTLTGPVGFVLGAVLLAHEHIDLRDDENAMYKVLEECETPEERAAMEAAYNKKFAPRTLRGEIAKLDGAEVDIATALLDGDKRKARAAKVKDGAGFFGDKELLFSAIQECESKEERDAMIAEFNRRYGAAAGGTDYNATLDETFEYNDLDREKAKQLTENGKMDDAYALFYAMHSGFLGSGGAGLGTDEEAIKKLLAGKSKEEIEELKKQYKELAAKYGWNRSLDADLDQEVSGRDGKQIEMLLRGEPTTAAEAMARQEEMAEFEREDVAGWAIDAVVVGMLGPLAVPWILLRLSGVVDTDELAKGAVDIWNDSDEDLKAANERLRHKLDEINRTMVKTPGESDADFEKRKLEAFKKELANEEGYLKNYQEKKDETADVASTGVSLVVTAALSIASGGAAAWACALIGGMAGIGAKAAILGGSYATEDFGMDVLEVVAEAVAAGVAKGLDIDEAFKGLKALGVADDLVEKIIKEALEEAIENGTSELILALFNEDNYDNLDAFIFGVGGAVLQAAVSGAAAAAVMVTLGALWDKKFGDPAKIKDPIKRQAMSALKGAVTEGIGGLAASAVDPATWEGDMEAVLTRFGRGFIDNILSAGAEGIGEAVGAAHHGAKVDANRKRLADQGVGNTAVVSGNIVDLDSGRVFDGESGEELGRISVDPDTGEVTDVTDLSNPVRIGINENLEGVRVGGVDTNAQAAANPGANPDANADANVQQAAPTQADVDEAMAKAEAHDRANVEQASVEKARAVVAGMTGDARPGSSLEVATRIAAELALNGVTVELFGDDSHHFLKIGETVIDGALLELFDAPAGTSPEIFIGSMDELRARLGELEASFGLRSDLAADTTVDQLFDSRFGGASASGLTLDIDASAGTAQFSDAIDRGPGRIDADFPGLAGAASVNSNVVFGELQQARARAALEGMSDADYIKMRTLMAAQQSDLARVYLLKALAAGNSMGEIERFASKIHGQIDGWLVANLSMADPLQLAAGGGLAQQFTHSCNANMLIALMSDLDPVLALRMRENPDTAELLRRLEQRMLETPFQGDPNLQPAEAGVAVPLEPGADFAAGRGRFISDFLNQQSSLTGVSFSTEMNPTVGHVIDVLDASLGLGVDVPVVVGQQPGEPTHYVLVTGRRVDSDGFAEYRFYDPATGTSRWISAADIIGGRLGLGDGSLNLVTAMEVPSVAAGADLAPDTEPMVDPQQEPGTPGGFDAEQELAVAMSQTPDERRIVLGTDPKRGFMPQEGEVGPMIEAAHGFFRRDPSGDLDWISLSGPEQGKTFDLLGIPPGKDHFHGDDMARFFPTLTKHFHKADFVVLDVRFMRPAQVKSVMDFIDQNHANDKPRLIVIS